MIRAQFTKLAAGELGISSNYEADKSVAGHCEARLRALLQSAQAVREHNFHRPFTPQDFNAVLAHHHVDPITVYPKYNPLTANYSKISDTTRPSYPIGFIFASNTSNNITQSTTPNPSNEDDTLGTQTTRDGTNIIPVRDLIYVKDDMCSVKSLLERGRTHRPQPKLAIFIHHSSIGGSRETAFQPLTLTTPISALVDAPIQASQLFGENISQPRIPQSKLHLLLNYNPSRHDILTHYYNSARLNIAASSEVTLAHQAFLQELRSKKLAIVEKRNIVDNIQVIDGAQGKRKHVLLNSGANGAVSDEKHLLSKLPIPLGSQIVLLKQEHILSLSTDQLAFLQVILRLITTNTHTVLYYSHEDFLQSFILHTSLFRMVVPSEFLYNRLKENVFKSSFPTTSPSLLTITPFITRTRLINVDLLLSLHKNNNIAILTDILPIIIYNINKKISSLLSLNYILTALRIIYIIVNNNNVNLEPYLTQILGLLLTLLVSKKVASSPVILHNTRETTKDKDSNKDGKELTRDSSVLQNCMIFNSTVIVHNVNSASSSSSATPGGPGTNNTLMLITPASITATALVCYPPALAHHHSAMASDKENFSRHYDATFRSPALLARNYTNHVTDENIMNDTHVKNLVIAILNTLLKQFNSIYPTIMIRINSTLNTLLSNFFVYHHNTPTTTIIAPTLAQHEAFRPTSNTNTNHNEAVLLCDDDEVDLISSTYAIAQKQLNQTQKQLLAFSALTNNTATIPSNLYHTHYYYTGLTPTPHSQQHAIMAQQSQFSNLFNSFASLSSLNYTFNVNTLLITTNIAPITHYSIVLYILTLPINVIIKHFSHFFPLLSSFYSNVINIPLVGLDIGATRINPCPISRYVSIFSTQPAQEQNNSYSTAPTATANHNYDRFALSIDNCTIIADSSTNPQDKNTNETLMFSSNNDPNTNGYAKITSMTRELGVTSNYDPYAVTTGKGTPSTGSHNTINSANTSSSHTQNSTSTVINLSSMAPHNSTISINNDVLLYYLYISNLTYYVIRTAINLIIYNNNILNNPIITQYVNNEQMLHKNIDMNNYYYLNNIKKIPKTTHDEDQRQQKQLELLHAVMNNVNSTLTYKISVAQTSPTQEQYENQQQVAKNKLSASLENHIGFFNLFDDNDEYDDEMEQQYYQPPDHPEPHRIICNTIHVPNTTTQITSTAPTNPNALFNTLSLYQPTTQNNGAMFDTITSTLIELLDNTAALPQVEQYSSQSPLFAPF